MDSPAPTAPPGAKAWIPLAAVIQEDLRQSLRHWAFLAWAALALAFPTFQFLRLPSPAEELKAAFAPPAGDAEDGVVHRVAKPQQRSYDQYGREIVPSAPDYNANPRTELQDRPAPYERPATGVSAATSGAWAVRWHLLVWWFLAAAFGAGAIAGEINVAGDAVLCWGVSRWQYFLGKCAARAIAAMMLFVASTAPMLWLFTIRADADITLWGAVRTLSAVATALGALVVFSVSLGAWFRHAAPAVAAAALTILAAGAVGWWLGAAEWSPAALSASIGPGLRGADLTSGLPKLLCAAAACWAGISAVRFRFVDL